MRHPTEAGRRRLPSRYLAALATGLLMASLSVGAQAVPPEASPAQVFQMAMEHQSMGEYGPMLSHLRAAAQAGYLPAQEMLTPVLLSGATLYGDPVPTDRCEAARWAKSAAVQGSAVGREYHQFLSRLRWAPDGQDRCAAR